MPKELEIFGTKPTNGYKAVFGNERGNLAGAVFKMILHIEDIVLITGEGRVSSEASMTHCTPCLSLSFCSLYNK